MFDLLLTEAGGIFSRLFGSSSGIAMTVLYIVAFLAIMYFLMIRPSQKEQKKMSAMKDSMEVGDYIVTTSGFYGQIIDVDDDDIVVEFGNNKNCRIPMKKEAVASLEKKENGSN